MKSLIIKDLYNIGHNVKSMILIVLFFAVMFIPSSQVGSYIAICCVLCTTMVITTFSFDDFSGWDRYAMIMPVTKKELVAGKFVVLLIFSGIGCLSSLVLGTVGSLIFHKIGFDWESISGILVMALGSFAIAVVLGSISLPLVFKFGAEKARMLLMVSFVIPFLIFFGIYKFLQLLGVTVTESTVQFLLYLSPVIALVWTYVMYKISYRIFAQKEF